MTLRKLRLVKPGEFRNGLNTKIPDIPVKGRRAAIEWDVLLERLIASAQSSETVDGIRFEWTPDARNMIGQQLQIEDVARWLRDRFGLGGFTRDGEYAAIFMFTR